LTQKRKTFTPEFKREAAKMVIETSRPIAQVARDLGISEQTLRNWVNAYRRDHGEAEEPATTVSERARLAELEREVAELRMENQFLKKAAAYFAKDHR
jgi:transposase